MTASEQTTATARPNRFSRHPVLTLLLTLAVLVLGCDLLTARLYRLLHGHSWALRSLYDNRCNEQVYRIPSPRYHHDLKAGIAIDTALWGPISYRIRTNSLGFKDRQVRDVPLSSERHRILFIGDSFTEGVGVEYPQTFVGLIDSTLQPRGIEVYNAAVSSYCPRIHLRKVQALLDKGFGFDELIVFLDISDPYDEALRYAGGLTPPPQDTAAPTPGPRAGPIRLIRDNTILLYSMLNTVQEKLLNPAPPTSNPFIGQWTVKPRLYERYARAGLQSMAAHMDSLHALVRGHDIDLTVTVYPWPYQLRYRDLDSRQVNFWQSWCRERHVRFMNFFPTFIPADPPVGPNPLLKRIFIPGDVHWNEEGHRMLATAFLGTYEQAVDSPARR